MATTTTNLLLTKPGFNEFFDSWHDVVNANMDLIDTAVGALQTLTAGAAGAASPATIHQRFLDAEAATTALQDLNDIKDAYTEGVPAADTYLGANHAVSGQSNIGKIWHSVGLQLLELTGVAADLDLDAGLKARMAQVSQGILSGAAGTLISFQDPTNIEADPAADFEVLVGGEYGIIRGVGVSPGAGPIVTLNAAVPGANSRFYVVATAVGWNNTAIGGATGTTSTSTFNDLGFAATDARPGDLLEITSGDDDVLGLYVVATMGAGTLTINGTFPKDVMGLLAYRFRRRHWVTLTLQKWGADIDQIVNGEAFLAGALIGTVLGHADMDGGSQFNFATNPAVQYSPGLNYDSGWVTGATFFDGSPMSVAAETITVDLPEIPRSWQLLWSAAATGTNAIPVPLEDNGGTFGVRQYWNLNALTVLAPTVGDVMQDTAGAALNQAAVDAGFFRLIAKG